MYENMYALQTTPIMAANRMNPDQTGSILFSIWATKNIRQAGKAAQWLSGRVLDSRPRGRLFKSHRHHCIHTVVLEQDTFILA